MDFTNRHDLKSKISKWLTIKKELYHDLEELSKSRITYNTSLLPMSVLTFELDSTENRYLLMANKGLAIADILDSAQFDATLLSESLFPRRGFVRDLSWFHTDNSLSAYISSIGEFKLIDMNKMKLADSFDLNIASQCIDFDTSGKFPFGVFIGTKSGIRICDLKSGLQIQHLKTKFDVECFEFSARNQNEIYSGLSNGKVLLWDLRKSTHPIAEITHPDKIETPVKQISHSNFTNGSIIIGYKNGNIVSKLSYSLDDVSWIFSSEDSSKGNGQFLITSFGDIIYPICDEFLFIDPFCGKKITSCENGMITSPSSIMMSLLNNVT